MSAKTLHEFRSKLRVDKFNLDREVMEQPEMFYHVCEGHQEALSKQAELASEVKQAEAAAGIKAREDLKDAKNKPTDTQIAAIVTSDERVIMARDLLLRANADVANWANMKEAYMQKSFMLKEASRLYEANYFQVDHTAPREERERPSPNAEAHDDIRSRAAAQRRNREQL